MAVGSWRQNAKTRFSGKLTNLLSWNWAFQSTHYWIPKIQDGWDPPSWKSTWRHFFAEGGPIWIIFRRLVQNDISTAVMWSRSKPDVELQYGGRLGESMACHPRATYHIVGCCHLVNSLSWFQCHMPHCRVQSPDEISVTIVRHCRV